MDEVVELNGTMKETEEQEEEQKTKNDGDGVVGDGDQSSEVVRWERYLPKMVITVLLVESDRSTRHVIAALLKKCSYRVITVSEGLKAWETLKRKASDIDLILTEVELPAISGFALLSLIMEHDTCKNIPVIMMSSQDSVSMVLKCMLKGAADFLIKPVRRNELTNLWQHVWRRHAVGMPLQNTTFPQKKLKIATKNNSASNQSSDTMASSQKINECSEKLSEAQSTCTSPFSETDNAYMEHMQNASHMKSFLNLSNIGVLNHEDPNKIERESTKHNDETEGSRLEHDHGAVGTENKYEILRAELSRDNPNNDTEIRRCSDELIEPSSRVMDLMATFENLHKHAQENHCHDAFKETKFDFDTHLELSLRRDFSGSSCKQASEATEEWQRLNHSNTSAFSRYSGSKMLRPLFPNSSWSCNGSHKLSVISAGSYCHYGSSNKMKNMATAVIGQCGQVGPKLLNGGLLANNAVHHMWTPKPVCQEESSPFPSSSSSQSNPESHNTDQQHHCSYDASYSCLSQNVIEKNDLDHARHDSPNAGQKSVGNDCHASNNINSSGSDGSATSTIVTKKNPESYSDRECYDYDGHRFIDSHRSSQREAALTKFRQKRKERYYGKKVRYQSRKRLAEQRPRVKGQFVRQVCNDDHPIADASGDP